MTMRTTKPKSDAGRGFARSDVLRGLALSMALVVCTAPPPPGPVGDVPDGLRFARTAAESLLTLSAYDYGLAGNLAGQTGRVVLPDRYAAVARSLARALIAQSSAVVVVSASAAGPVRARLVPLADSLTDVARAANAYADGREPSAFAGVALSVRASWDRLRELASVLPPNEALLRTLARGSQIAASLALGAQGVWCGTVWLGTRESELDPFEKEVLFETRTEDAVRRKARTGKTVRMIKSKLSEAWEQPGAPTYLPTPLQGILYNEAHARVVRAKRKDLYSFPAGQVVGMINEEATVREVMYRMQLEYLEAVERLNHLSPS